MRILPHRILFLHHISRIENPAIRRLEHKLKRNLRVVLERDAILEIETIFLEVRWITEWQVGESWEGVLCCLQERRRDVLREVHYELAGLLYAVEPCGLGAFRASYGLHCNNILARIVKTERDLLSCDLLGPLFGRPPTAMVFTLASRVRNSAKIVQAAIVPVSKWLQ